MCAKRSGIDKQIESAVRQAGEVVRVDLRKVVGPDGKAIRGERDGTATLADGRTVQFRAVAYNWGAVSFQAKERAVRLWRSTFNGTLADWLT